MTNAAKAVMWEATWTPWGAPHAITGAAVLDARFILLARLRQDGQWFQRARRMLVGIRRRH